MELQGETIAAIVTLGIPFVASVLSAVLPDGHWLMKAVNVLAVNVAKAKNDPKVQR